MRTLAAIILIAIGSIGALYLGFVAMFAVGAITSDADGVRSQIGALLVTATPFFAERPRGMASARLKHWRVATRSQVVRHSVRWGAVLRCWGSLFCAWKLAAQ